MKSFDDSIKDFHRDLACSSRRDQRGAAARRRKAAAAGVPVPPLMILSDTQGCDLRAILGDARDLGVPMVALAGGESLARPEIVHVAADFPEMLFPLITNGSPMDDSLLDKLLTLRNVIPVMTLEGLDLESGAHMGGGACRRALDAMARLQERGIAFGASVTVTRRNFGLVTSRRFVRDLVDRGARLFFFVDYAPAKAGMEHLVPSPTQRDAEPLTMMLLRSEFRAMFVAPSNSKGGCAVWAKRDWARWLTTAPEGAPEDRAA